MYYGLLACWGLGESVIIACLLGVVSDLCTVNQIPILLGLELMAEGIGGITLVPLAGGCLTIKMYSLPLSLLYPKFKFSIYIYVSACGRSSKQASERVRAYMCIYTYT